MKEILLHIPMKLFDHIWLWLNILYNSSFYKSFEWLMNIFRRSCMRGQNIIYFLPFTFITIFIHIVILYNHLDLLHLWIFIYNKKQQVASWICSYTDISEVKILLGYCICRMLLMTGLWKSVLPTFEVNLIIQA